MTAITITSVFQTLRPCLVCGTEFYPPKRPDRLVLDYCSPPCEQRAGLKAAQRSDMTRIPSIEPRRRGKDTQPRRLGSRQDIPRSAFAARLIRFRRDAKLTQRMVAQRIGVSHRSMDEWERDLSDPGVRRLAALAALFGTSMDYLWTGNVGVGRAGAAS